MRHLLLVLSCFLLVTVASAQEAIAPDSATITKRKHLVAAIFGGTYGASFISLNKTWYANYPRSSFHFYNDGKEWLQMDKAGHFYSSYNLARISHKAWAWTGVSEKKAVTLSALTSISYLTIIETMDGFSDNWGWSWLDMTANTAGVLLWSAQQLKWKEQKFRLKYSAHYTNYADPAIQARANNYFGKSLPERFLKDYNAQTIWLSANIKSIWPEAQVPKWLNIATGYGIDNTYGGYENGWMVNNQYYTRPDLKRSRQYYLSLDVDFERIKSNKKWVRGVLTFLNFIKLPAPALSLSNGKLSGSLIYF
ncbi:MAG: YfiM family protein [Bacteroidetes bacterium]|nr:YfiM family protein [Bacteroidota bacterium]